MEKVKRGARVKGQVWRLGRGLTGALRQTHPNVFVVSTRPAIASIDAQFKASSLAFDAMQAMHRAEGPDNCQQLPLLYDTRIESRPETGAWSEIWSMAYCDVKHDFRMTFTPANGTVTVKSERIG